MKIMGKPLKGNGPRFILALLFLLVILPGLWAPIWAQRRNRQNGGANPLEGNPAAIDAGQKLFSGACGGCHGALGEGGRGPNLEDGSLVRRRGAQQLFGSIKNGVAGTDMPPFNLPDEQIWQVLAYISSLSAPAAEAHVPGDPEAGKIIFDGKGNCVSCHMLQGHGGALGPDLSNVGMSHSIKQLKQAVVDPNSQLKPGYEGVTVVTNSGQQFTGVAKYHTNYSVAVQDAKGNLHLLLMRDVKKITFHKGSLMPGDYQKRLSAGELDDLLAFLSRQTVRPIKAQNSSASPAGDPQ